MDFYSIFDWISFTRGIPMCARRIFNTQLNDLSVVRFIFSLFQRFVDYSFVFYSCSYFEYRKKIWKQNKKVHAIDIAHTIASMLTMYQTKRKTCKIFDFRFDFFLLGFWLSSKVELVDFFCKRTKRFSIWKINMRNELGKKRRKKMCECIY